MDFTIACEAAVRAATVRESVRLCRGSSDGVTLCRQPVQEDRRGDTAALNVIALRSRDIGAPLSPAGFAANAIAPSHYRRRVIMNPVNAIS